jgi:ethanolamine utilization cobalamin adenosyltransferase
MSILEELVSLSIECWLFVDIAEVKTSKINATEIIQFANRLNIPIAQIHFAYTNGIIHFINSKAIDIHISDDISQLLTVRHDSTCTPIHSLANPHLHQQCIAELHKFQIKWNQKLKCS